MSTDPHGVRMARDELDTAARMLFDEITGGVRAGPGAPFPLVRQDGALTGPFATMLLSPEVGSALQELGSAIRFRSGLDGRRRELAVLTVATHMGCHFEWNSHVGIARAEGVDERDLAAIARSDYTVFGGTDLECLRLVAWLIAADGADPPPLPLTAPKLRFEICTLVGYYRLLALQLRLFTLDDEEGHHGNDDRPRR